MKEVCENVNNVFVLLKKRFFYNFRLILFVKKCIMVYNKNELRTHLLLAQIWKLLELVEVVCKLVCQKNIY